MSRKPIASSATHAPAQSSIAEGHNNETASITGDSDEEEKEIDNVEYLLVLQQIRQEARKISKSNYKRQFSTLSAEFRGHASVMAEEMNAYIDEMEKDALDTRNRECIGAQDVINAAPEWKPQHVDEARVVDFSGIQREKDVNEGSKLIEATAMEHAQAHRRLLRKVKADLGELRQQEKIATDARALVKQYKKLFRQ